MENGDDGGDRGRFVAWVGDFFGANGIGEGGDEAEEVLTGEGVVEAAEVVGGLDDLGGSLEMVGRGNLGDREGLGDRGEDDGLLGIRVWGEVDGGGSDWAVVWGRGDVGEGGRRSGHRGWGSAFAAGWGGKVGGVWGS